MRTARAILFCVLFFGGLATNARGDFGPEEPVLYAGGFPSAETLRKKELLFYPIPWGWVAYGATERLTVGWDYTLGLLGYPAFLARFKLADTGRSIYSIEGYAVGIPRTLDDDRQDDLRVRHGQGAQSWIHLSRSGALAERLWLHAYAGANYKTAQDYLPRGSAHFQPVAYRNHVNPDAGIDLEWRIRPWVRMHVNYSYGNTFYFVDQVAIKSLAAWSFHFAPWTSHRWALIRNFRFDLSALWVHIPDGHFKRSLPLPIYPTAYWQF